MNHSRTTAPCPLGGRCPDGGEHYTDSKVYKEHLHRSIMGGAPKQSAAAVAGDGTVVAGTNGSMRIVREGLSRAKVVTPRFTMNVGKEMERELTEQKDNDVPITCRPTWMTTAKMERKMIQDGYSSPGAYAARMALNFRAGERSVTELLGEDSESLAWVIDQQGFNEPDGGDSYEDAYSLAPKLWKKHSMKTEFVESAFDPNTGAAVGKVSISADVDGSRQSAEFDLDGRELGANAGPAALVQALEYYTFCKGNATSAQEYTEIVMLDQGLLSMRIDDDEFEGADVSRWKGLNPEQRRELFKEEFEEAYEEMESRFDEFDFDRKEMNRKLEGD